MDSALGNKMIVEGATTGGIMSMADVVSMKGLGRRDPIISSWMAGVPGRMEGWAPCGTEISPRPWKRLRRGGIGD